VERERKAIGVKRERERGIGKERKKEKRRE